MSHPPRPILALPILTALAIAALSATPRVHAQDERCFRETGYCISGRFRHYWEQNGGLAVFGFPIAPAREENNRDTGQIFLAQWFERTRFELHPENRAPYDVLLGRVGDDALRRLGRAAPAQPREPGPQAGCLWFEQTGHNVCDQGAGLGFKTYWQTHGLQLDGRRGTSYDESLALFGLPLTEPQIEANAPGDSVLTQWFERARFEWHPDKPDQYKVLLGLLGAELVGGTRETAISDLMAVGGRLFFVASDGRSGLELWKSDGTLAGTVQVKDINPGVGDAFEPLGFHWLTSAGGTLYFTAQDGIHGYELWKSDGTAAGTVMVKDIDPEPGGAYPAFITAVNKMVFFVASDGVAGRELWKSDGTEAGTLPVKVIRRSGAGSTPSNLTNVNGTLFFQAFDDAHGAELWKSDGTEAGTVLVRDIQPGLESSSPDLLTNVSGRLFFTARTNDTGAELWKSDGTEAGTMLVRDIQPGPTDSRPERLVAISNTLFFDAVGPTIDLEVWKSDGTAEGTVAVRDINPGLGRAGPNWLTGSGGRLFFAAEEPLAGRELWRSDGTEAGTGLVKDIAPGPSGAGPDWLTDVGGRLFFFADDGRVGRELWRSDGSAEGTALVRDITPGPGGTDHGELTDVAGTLFFVTDSGGRKALWKSDGTDAGTKLVKDIGTQ